MLRLYDTRRRAVVPFRPLSSPITLYVCGVTPYDTTHLGHARTFLVFDVLVRHLEAAGKAVRYAQNVTDVDESILQRAARDRVSWRDLGRSEERAFLADMRRLGWRKPDVMPHATRELPSMRGIIDVLVGKGCAYDPEGGIYFDTSRDRHYGELSRFSAARMRRILAAQDDAALDDPQRRHPMDFALWRRVPSGPTWPSRYGRGRPGWHIECSAMSLRHLGPRIAREALRLYLLDRHYRRAFDHDKAELVRAGERAAALAEGLSRGPIGPLGRDAATREVLAALDDDLDTRAAIRALERAARTAGAGAKRSLRYVARRVLGIL